MAVQRGGSCTRAIPQRFGVAIVGLMLSLIAAITVLWFWSRDEILAYGDAEAHLNIARKLWDNRAPSYREIGTVWLPLPHLLMLPFTWSDALYRSGLAGAIPSAICWVGGGLLLFSAIRRLTGAWEPAACAVSIYGLNPNLLYLAATPMTEPLFYMALAGLLHALVSYRETGRSSWVAAAVLWTWCAALTRYEGWLLIPVAAVALWRGGGGLAVGYSLLATLAPLYVFGHNWWIYGDALEFYRGEWSPRAIYDRTHSNGFARFPGEGHLAVAWLYYRTAAQLALGTPLLVIAVAGSIGALWKRWWWVVLLLIAGPALTLWGMQSGGGVEIFAPTLWPESYYNSRYALALLPLGAFGGAALVSIVPRYRGSAALIVTFAAVTALLAYPRFDNWIVWKEGQVNSVERRAWTHEMAGILRRSYQPGDRIFYSFGDLTGVLREAGIPLRVGLQSGNELEWYRTLARPDLFLDEEWVLDFADGKAAQAAAKRYTMCAQLRRDHKAPAVVLMHREGVPLH